MSETKTDAPAKIKYTPTIGLEIHAELSTATKMFCDSPNDPDETRPNVNVCPICMGHPGTLPTLNRAAIKHVLKIGHAVDGEIADYTEWDRKHYFYPDIPKGYQISQYKYPLVRGGKIVGVKLTRIHLEEDTGTSVHDRGDYSLVNYNRAGVPLMELVTEPVIHSAREAADFARELQLLLRYLNASEANMEKGEMRVEANISIAPADESGNDGSINVDGTINFDKLGTKVEVKNLNSFKSVERAIDFEVARMTALLDEGRGDEIVQETRGWDEAKQRTFTQRRKETSDDYRYFPEPDLPKLIISEISEFAPEILRAELPELPWVRRERYSQFDLGNDQVEVFVSNPRFAKILDEVIGQFGDNKKLIKLAVNYITSDLISLENENGSESAITSSQIIELVGMIDAGEISSRGAKDILAIMVKDGGLPKEIAEAKGLLQQNDADALVGIVEDIIKKNPEVVAELRAGKEASLQFLIGQGMRETRGTANPQILAELFKERL